MAAQALVKKLLPSRDTVQPTHLESPPKNRSSNHDTLPPRLLLHSLFQITRVDRGDAVMTTNSYTTVEEEKIAELLALREGYLFKF